jgi:phosphohistidine phosphatase
MKCYFLRHGLAVDPGEWHGEDFDRPLTGEGKDRMAREAATIAGFSLDLDAIVTSPLVRAKQTAMIVARKMDLLHRLVEDERLGIGFSADALKRILQERPETTAILLVGHEPSMSQTVGSIVGGARIDFRKGSLACVSLADAASLSGELMWLIPPKVLARE